MTLAIATVSSVAPASQLLYFENQYRPSRIAVKQNGNYHHVSVHGLVWTKWNQPVASGEGTYTFQFCTPEAEPCADAAFYDTPVLVKLSGIRVCKGRASYTKLAVTSNSSVPNTLVKPFSINASGCRGRARK